MWHPSDTAATRFGLEAACRSNRVCRQTSSKVTGSLRRWMSFAWRNDTWGARAQLECKVERRFPMKLAIEPPPVADTAPGKSIHEDFNKDGAQPHDHLRRDATMVAQAERHIVIRV